MNTVHTISIQFNDWTLSWWEKTRSWDVIPSFFWLFHVWYQLNPTFKKFWSSSKMKQYSTVTWHLYSVHPSITNNIMTLILVRKWSLEKLKKSKFCFQNEPRKHLSVAQRHQIYLFSFYISTVFSPTVSLGGALTSMPSSTQLLYVSCCGQEPIMSGVFVILLSFPTSCGWTNYTIRTGLCFCDISLHFGFLPTKGNPLQKHKLHSYTQTTQPQTKQSRIINTHRGNG